MNVDFIFGINSYFGQKTVLSKYIVSRGMEGGALYIITVFPDTHRVFSKKKIFIINNVFIEQTRVRS